MRSQMLLRQKTKSQKQIKGKMEIKGYRGSVVTVFYTGLGGGGGGRNRLCRKPLPEEVCFNADSVPAEAVMLICPPC